MNLCFLSRRRLLVYSEGEVSLDERARIEAHLKGCARCREHAKQIHQRIDLIRSLPLLEPANELGDAIARDLSASRCPEPIREAFSMRQPGFGRKWLLRPAGIAAAFFIIATTLLLVSSYELLPGSHKGELNLAGYLDLVGAVASAEPALREFPAAPGFAEVSRQETGATVAFPVIAPEILPGRYRLAAVRLYTHGDFHALQLKYQSERDGLCVFQLPTDSPLSFGERQSEECEIDGIRCRRLSSKGGCAIYPFVLGETQCALMMRQQDPATVGALMQAFKDECKKLDRKRG